MALIETCQQYLARRLSEGWRIAGRHGHSVFLSPPDGSFIRPIDLRNDTETLRPNAAGAEESISNALGNGVGTHYTCVNEETPDENATLVYDATFSWKRDLYALPAHSEGSGTINSVKVYVRCRYNGEQVGIQCRPCLRSDSTVTDGTAVDITGSWVTYSQQWDTNPADSEAWEWTDIDDLQIGVGLLGYSAAYYAMCTQVYVEIDYTPPTPPYSPATRSAAMAAKMIAGKMI